MKVEHHTLPECNRDESSNPGASFLKPKPKSAKKPTSGGPIPNSKHKMSAKSARVQHDEQQPHPRQVSKSLSTANLRFYFRNLKHMSMEGQMPACPEMSLQNSAHTKRKSSD